VVLKVTEQFFYSVIGGGKMNNLYEVINQKFHKQLFWLDSWISNERKDFISFSNEKQEMIFDNLVQLWNKTPITILLDQLTELYGMDEVKDVIELVVAGNNKSEWAKIAENGGSNSIEDLIGHLLIPIQGKDGFEFTLEKKGNGMQMHCLECPHVQLEKALGNAGWIYSFVCSGDPHIVSGFNSQMGFKRSKTLVEGDECCNHFYYLKEEGGSV